MAFGFNPGSVANMASDLVENEHFQTIKINPANSGEKASQIYTANVDINPSGSNLLIPGVSGKKINVVSYMVVSRSVQLFAFFSNANRLTGDIPLVANGGISFSSFYPCFVANVGESLNIVKTETGWLTGHLSYYLT